MFKKNSLLLFVLLSFILHIFCLFYFNPSSFLFSNIQNIKIKKKVTKVKFIKIIEKPKPKPAPKVVTKPKRKRIIKIKKKVKKKIEKAKIEKKIVKQKNK